MSNTPRSWSSMISALFCKAGATWQSDDSDGFSLSQSPGKWENLGSFMGVSWEFNMFSWVFMSMWWELHGSLVVRLVTCRYCHEYLTNPPISVSPQYKRWFRFAVLMNVVVYKTWPVIWVFLYFTTSCWVAMFMFVNQSHILDPNKLFANKLFCNISVNYFRTEWRYCTIPGHTCWGYFNWGSCHGHWIYVPYISVLKLATFMEI